MKRFKKQLTAKRLRNRAQGWSEATTLGHRESEQRNPDGLAANLNLPVTRRSRFASTLGFVSKPLRGLLCLAVISFFGLLVQAQSATIVSGHVTDERNANIAGADVRLIPRTGATLVAATNADSSDTEAVSRFTRSFKSPMTCAI